MPKTRPVARHQPPARRPARSSRLPLGAPPRAWALSGWALVPLRIFLGVTFLYAGLQKLANPNFLNAQSPISIQQQLIASVRVSPVHSILSHFVKYAGTLGVIIAFAEVAIGVGTLLGLWTRVAALGGAALSLVLFLTVSFHASPFYTGADIVFLFAWLPFILAGAGSSLSLDARIAQRAARRLHVPDPAVVAIPFAQVQAMCGYYQKGACAARGGAVCEAAACPVLLGPRPPIVTGRSPDELDRRTVVRGASAAAALGAGALVLGGAVAEVGRLIGGAPTPQGPHSFGGSTTTTTPAGGTPSTTTAHAGRLLGPAKDVPVGNAASFTIPTSGDPGIVVQPISGQFVAYDAVCPHAGCTVGYYAANHLLACPCHGSTFALSTGAVLGGPAPHGLTKLNVVEESDGNLYLR
jgi:thiosulfate dehydrogenase [quinone] large subunit